MNPTLVCALDCHFSRVGISPETVSSVYTQNMTLSNHILVGAQVFEVDPGVHVQFKNILWKMLVKVCKLWRVICPPWTTQTCHEKLFVRHLKSFENSVNNFEEYLSQLHKYLSFVNTWESLEKTFLSDTCPNFRLVMKTFTPWTTLKNICPTFINIFVLCEHLKESWKTF